MALLDRDNELLKRKSTALEVKRLRQRQQGGIGGAGGTAVDGQLANNKILSQPNELLSAPRTQLGRVSPGLTASTVPTGNLNETQLQARSELETAELVNTPVRRAPGPTLGAQDPQQAEFLQAVLDERRLNSPGQANVQGAFDSQGRRIGDGGSDGGTLSVVGQDSGTAAANQQFLDEFRADRAARIARTRQAEALGEVSRGADRRRDEQRKALESRLFQLGVGRYRANRKEDAAILKELAPFLSGDTDQISSDVASQLGLLSQREADAAATSRERIGANADIAETRRKAIADQFEQQLDLEKEAREAQASAFDQSLDLRKQASEEARLGGDLQLREQEQSVRERRLELDQNKLNRNLSKDRNQRKKDSLSFIAETAQTNPKMVPGLVENSLDNFGDSGEQLQFLRNMVDGQFMDRETANQIAMRKGLIGNK